MSTNPIIYGAAWAVCAVCAATIATTWFAYESACDLLRRIEKTGGSVS